MTAFATLSRRQVMLSGAAFGAAAMLPRAALAAPKVGQAAPAFTAVDSKGQQYTLKGLAGRFVVLEWTNHDCPFVRKHYGANNMQTLQKAATAQGVVWLSVMSSAPGQQGYVEGAEADKLTASRNASPTAVLLDPEGTIGSAYDARTTPHMYIISPEGKLLYMGGIDSVPSANKDDIAKAEPLFHNALLAALAGKAIDKSVTRPYGCSVKYGV